MATTTIQLKDFASFSPITAVSVKVSKPVAMIYGHNGVGKSTIARALRHHADSSLGPAGSCSVVVEGLTSPEFFIYDADYVEQTFQSKDDKGIRGIFTLGKKTAEDLNAILESEGDEKAAQQRIADCEAELTACNKRVDAADEKAKLATWPIKTDFEKGPLRFCIADRKMLADKLKMFNFLHDLPKGDGTHVLESLLAEAKEIDDENASTKPVLSIPKIEVDEIEKNPLLAAVIVGSTDSKLSPLIAKLQNEDWVRKGKSYPHADGNQCPFCQQVMPNDFAQEVAKLFDSAYEEHCAQLRTLRENYSSELDSFKSEFSTTVHSDDYVALDAGFQSAIKDVQLVLERNLAALDRKVAKPGDPATIESSSPILATLATEASRVRSRIIEYNSKIANVATVKADLDRRFWERMKHDYAAPLATFDSEAAAIQELRTNIAESLTKARADKLAAQQRLKELRKDSTNIDASVHAINHRIKSIGISGFAIEKDLGNPGYYHIARGAKGKVAYKSLSEGEKTLITFLYFVESLDGSHESDGNANKANRIVVIDDPVSSLSHNHVYDIASLITNVLITGGAFPHVIVLTHSLFFFHEMIRSAGESGKTYQCFRVVKNEFSDVTPMAWDEIKNDYQAFWLIIREAIETKKYSVAIPIAMRYVLEHYFSFIGYHSVLRKALLNLGQADKEFQAFYRYVNRQSHSDEINISDLPAIDPSIYLEKFKQVFVKTEHTRHFNHMMGIAEPTEAAAA